LLFDIKVSRFPSFAYVENRLRSTALRSLLLAGANCKHSGVSLPFFRLRRNRAGFVACADRKRANL
jgi:hypothetical protein